MLIIRMENLIMRFVILRVVQKKLTARLPDQTCSRSSAAMHALSIATLQSVAGLFVERITALQRFEKIFIKKERFLGFLAVKGSF